MKVCVDIGSGPMLAKSSRVSLTLQSVTQVAVADETREHLQIAATSDVYLGGSDVSSSNGYLVPGSGYNPLILEGAAAKAAIYVYSESSAIATVLEIVSDAE